MALNVEDLLKAGQQSKSRSSFFNGTVFVNDIRIIGAKSFGPGKPSELLTGKGTNRFKERNDEETFIFVIKYESNDTEYFEYYVGKEFRDRDDNSLLPWGVAGLILSIAAAIGYSGPVINDDGTITDAFIADLEDGADVKMVRYYTGEYDGRPSYQNWRTLINPSTSSEAAAELFMAAVKDGFPKNYNPVRVEKATPATAETGTAQKEETPF